MAESTGIEWCDATFNPWWGCERVSPGCANCYAADWARFRGRVKQLWSKALGEHVFQFPADAYWRTPLLWADRARRGLLPKGTANLDGHRPRVFCASMADVFEEREEIQDARVRLMMLIERTPELDWLVLTKRPEFARDWLAGWYEAIERGNFPAGDRSPRPYPNMWLGTSIENARFTYRADVLREIPAAVRFISAEPLLGSLYPETFECPRCEGQRYDVGSCFLCANRGRLDDHGSRDRMPLDLTGIDWVIVGGESGSKARPFHLEHAREIIDRSLGGEAAASLVPGRDRPAVFVKQLGAKPVFAVEDERRRRYDVPYKLRDRKGGDIEEFPTDLRIREFPRSGAPCG